MSVSLDDRIDMLLPKVEYKTCAYVAIILLFLQRFSQHGWVFLNMTYTPPGGWHWLDTASGYLLSFIMMPLFFRFNEWKMARDRQKRLLRMTLELWRDAGFNDDMLSFFNMQLSYIPEVPNNVRRLNMSRNRLRTLPPLPSRLVDLDISYNDIQSIDELPSDLQYLDVSGNRRLRRLPPLPTGLKQLNISSTALEELPALPSGLEILCITNTPLRSLPPLPVALEHLAMWDTAVRDLTLPPNLEVLLMMDTPITELDCVPALRELHARGSALTVVNHVPDGLVLANVTDTPYAAAMSAVVPEETELRLLGGRMVMINDDAKRMRVYWEHLMLMRKTEAVMRTWTYKEDLMKACWNPERAAMWWYHEFDTRWLFGSY